MTAAFATTSGSASGKTMNGACPPSSRLSRLTWSAACRISCLPTSVEPVKLIFRTAGFAMNSSAISLRRADDQVRHARRQPGVDAGTRRRSMQRQRRLAGRLADDRATGREGRGDLAGLQRDREVPRPDGRRPRRPGA